MTEWPLIAAAFFLGFCTALMLVEFVKLVKEEKNGKDCKD